MIGSGDRVGAYRVIREIGEGGMAWVYQVEGVDDHPNRTFRGRTFALKLMKPQVSASEELIRRFEREADLQVGFQHPALLTIFDYGRDPEHGFYYTMTFVEGTNLSQKTKREGPLPLQRVGEVYTAVLSALAELHKHEPPVVHRDVKPSNILLAEAGHVFLSDLGVARLADGSGQTRTSALLGTALYLSPEQARGRDVDPRSDLYSVGLCLYHSLTGHSIYDDVEDVRTDVDADVIGYLGHLERIREELEADVPTSLPAPLAEVIRRATRIRPEDRYASADEMKLDLQAALRASEVGLVRRAPRPSGEPAPAILERSADTARASRPSPWRRGLAIATGVVAIGGLTWLVGRGGAGSEQAPFAAALGALQLASGAALERAERDAAVDADALEVAARLRTYGDDFAAVAGTAHLDGDEAAALAAAERARGSYEASCSHLRESGPAARAAEGEAALRARAEQLRGVGAPTYVSDHWGRLQARLAAIAAPVRAAAPCDALHGALDRLAAIAAGEAALGRVEQELQPLLPEIAGEAFDRAGAARPEAAPASPAHRSAVATGEEALASARAARDAGAWLDAAEDSMRAEAAFARAGEIARADLARERAGAALAEASAQRLDNEALRLDRERADRLYAAAGYAEAARQFERIVHHVEGSIENAEQSRAARQIAVAAERAREQASEAWAETAAPDTYARAESLHERGARALAQQRYTVARAEYERAEAAYRRATVLAGRERKRADEAAAAAEQRAAAWGTSAERCELSPDPVRGSCEAGFAALATARSEIAQLRPLEAIAQFDLASRSFGRAAVQQRELEAGLPPSPSIRGRSPAAHTVRLRRGERVTLAVEAEGSELDYLWLVDGEPQAVTGPRLEWTLESNAQVVVQVDDGDSRTEPVSTGWRLRVRNTLPQLVLSPEAGEEPLVLRVGSAIEYRAEAYDRDDDPIQIEYVVGDRMIRSDRFTFEAEEPGRHRIEVSASDGHGETTVTREVLVEARRWWQR